VEVCALMSALLVILVFCMTCCQLQQLICLVFIRLQIDDEQMYFRVTDRVAAAEFEVSVLNCIFKKNNL